MTTETTNGAGRATNNSSDPTIIPEGENLPQPKAAPRKFGALNNLAEDKELTDKAVAWMKTQLERFRNQDQRQNFCDAGGVMDVADRMARVALRRDEDSDQYQATLSNVACTAFFKGIRAMTAGERAVFFQENELPARYEPVLANYEGMQDDSRAVCDQRNMLAEYTWERDERRKKVGDTLYFNNKYGQQLLSMEWKFEECFVTERVKNKTGGYGFKTSKKVVADWPTLLSHPLELVYFDAQIDDVQQQRCIIREDPVPYETLLADYLGGKIKNLDKITSAHMYEKDYDAEAIEARSENAGEDAVQTKTGLLKQWTVWAWLPIQEKNGKGKWDETQLSSLYWATYIGENLDSSAVCARLLKNPYHHGRNPYLLLHAYSDDKGAYHVSPCETVLSLYWQAVTNWNQAHDNVTLRTRAPMITDGPVRTRDLTYKANKLIEVGRGVRFEPVKVPQTTEITMAMAQTLEADIYATLGTDKPILGMPMLGRTSASEAVNIYEQARTPLLQKADDNGQQLFQWMFEMDAALWEQYADPQLTLALTKADILSEFKPSRIYGPFKVSVKAVTEFESKTQKRRALNAFLQAGWDKLAPSMGKQGEYVAARIIWSEFAFPKVNEVFPPSGDYDAIRVAVNESDSMLNMGNYEEVKPQENHRAHSFVHDQAQSEYDYLPENEKSPDNERRHQGHMQKHRGYMEQQLALPPQQTALTQLGQQAPPPVPERLPGEMAAAPVEAELGGEANL